MTIETGPTMPPGIRLREAHAHVGALGEALATPTLADCTSVEECLERIRLEAGRAGPGEWLRMASARIEGWREARWPTIRELDGAAGGRACVVMSFDHHEGVANTAALAGAGLAPGVEVPPHGVVCADELGRPTGRLLEQAAWAAWSGAPAPSEGERRGFVAAALEHLAGLGYREVHDMLSEAWLGPVLAEMEGNGELALDVWLYAPVAIAERVAGDRALESGRVRFAGLKCFADGTLNGRTAFMTTAYRGADGREGTCGQLMMSDGELDAALGAARALGVGLAVHAIGDGAVRRVLDARERTGRTGVLAPNGTPELRIEHCELIDRADVARFAGLGVVCSVQPCHLLVDVEALTRYLPHRLDRVFPLRELIDAGCRPGELLWFGSDAPIVGADPRDSITAACTRRRPGAPRGEAIGWGQRLSETEAWAGFALPA